MIKKNTQSKKKQTKSLRKYIKSKKSMKRKSKKKGGSGLQRQRKIPPFVPRDDHNLDEIQLEELQRLSEDEKVKQYYGHLDNECRICNKPFTRLFVTGRHHCRNCYISICDKHTHISDINICRNDEGDEGWDTVNCVQKKKLCPVCDFYKNEYTGNIPLINFNTWRQIDYLRNLEPLRFEWLKMCILYNENRATIKNSSGKLSILCRLPRQLQRKIIEEMALPII